MLNKDQKKQLKEDYHFHSNGKLMKMYNLSRWEFQRFIRDEGMKRKHHIRTTEEQREYIRANAHKSKQELAGEMGMSYRVVAGILKKKK